MAVVLVIVIAMKSCLKKKMKRERGRRGIIATERTNEEEDSYVAITTFAPWFWFADNAIALASHTHKTAQLVAGWLITTSFQLFIIIIIIMLAVAASRLSEKPRHQRKEPTATLFEPASQSASPPTWIGSRLEAELEQRCGIAIRLALICERRRCYLLLELFAYKCVCMSELTRFRRLGIRLRSKLGLALPLKIGLAPLG